MKKNLKLTFKFSGIVIGSFFLMVVLVFYPLFIDIWVENDSGTLYELAKIIYDQKISTIYILLCISFVSTFVYWVFTKYLQANEQFEKDKRETSRTLLRKYQELKEFDQKKTLSIVMRNFCLKHDLIQAVQIYSYQNIPENKTMRCKIKHLDGYVKDKTDLNGMIQQNYYLDKKIYKEYTRSVNKFFNDVNNVNPLLEFISKQVMGIESKPLNNLKNKDVMIYALLMDSIDTLSPYFPGINTISINSRKAKKLEDLLKVQRNGIYRGILLGGFYTFFYDGKGTKEGRQYITNPITISNVKYISLITLDPDLLEEDEVEKNLQLRGYIEEFEEMLHSAFEKEYNDDIEGDEENAL
ncbi:hypothetical protein [Lysinibacillus sp. FSL K6-4013]|uniref:hypothetical protein n=1 Tax=Lysinibacillus sp. FSL K6-4013 TaxID=2921504 RepID=UPI00315A31E4